MANFGWKGSDLLEKEVSVPAVLFGLLCCGCAQAFAPSASPMRVREVRASMNNKDDPTVRGESVAQAVAGSVASTAAAAAHLGAWAAAETFEALGATVLPSGAWLKAVGAGVRAGANAFSTTIKNSTIVDVAFTTPTTSSDNARAATEAKSITWALSRVRAASTRTTSTTAPPPSKMAHGRARPSQRSMSTGLSVAAQREKEMLLRGPHSPLYYAENGFDI